MQGHWHILQILSIVTIFPMLLLSCGSDRVSIEFKTPRQIYVDDSKTDPDKLNKELEYDLREAEKNAYRNNVRQRQNKRPKKASRYRNRLPKRKEHHLKSNSRHSNNNLIIND